MFALSGLSVVGFFIYLTRETNVWIALFAVVVLLAMVAVIIVVLFIIAMSRNTKKETRPATR